MYSRYTKQHNELKRKKRHKNTNNKSRGAGSIVQYNIEGHSFLLMYRFLQTTERSPETRMITAHFFGIAITN